MRAFIECDKKLTDYSIIKKHIDRLCVRDIIVYTPHTGDVLATLGHKSVRVNNLKRSLPSVDMMLGFELKKQALWEFESQSLNAGKPTLMFREESDFFRHQMFQYNKLLQHNEHLLILLKNEKEAHVCMEGMRQYLRCGLNWHHSICIIRKTDVNIYKCYDNCNHHRED